MISRTFGSRVVVPWFTLAGLLCWMTCAATTIAGGKTVREEFRIKFVSGDAVYLDGGSNDGLKPGQKLRIRRASESESVAGDIPAAEIEIESVASVSAVAKVLSSASPVSPGDRACLSPEDATALKTSESSAETAGYLQVISFTEGNPPEQEVREDLPKPPSPAVNRFRGRIGIDYSNLQQSGGGIGSSQFGYLFQVNATRLLGSHWNLRGFHRGRFYSQSNGVTHQTLTDLINRTYHLSLTYENPASSWVAGIGRLYVPWASSLSTIDGLYLGRRFGRATVGGFGGTTPDPSSWNYNQHRQMAGGFVNLEGGSFESLRISSTSGIAISRIRWHPDRQFGFFENNLSYRRYLTVYSDLEFDYRNSAQNNGQSNLGLSRSYVTVGIQPHRIIRFDLSENYFRNLPTFDPRLIGTGLLDSYLFEGVNGGFHLLLPLRLGIYSTVGRSTRTNDVRDSWNYLLGVTGRDILHSGIRVDVRYSKFDSSFGSGNYRSLTIGRDIGDTFRFDLQAGQQNTMSVLDSETRTRFLNGSLDWILGRQYLLGFGMTLYRGRIESYNQFFVSLGYRFDSFRHLLPENN